VGGPEGEMELPAIDDTIGRHSANESLRVKAERGEQPLVGGVRVADHAGGEHGRGGEGCRSLAPAQNHPAPLVHVGVPRCYRMKAVIRHLTMGVPVQELVQDRATFQQSFLLDSLVESALANLIRPPETDP